MWDLEALEFVGMWSTEKQNFKSWFTCLKNLQETDSVQETIPYSRVNIHSFAFQARSLEEASRPCSHLVMSSLLPRWINAGRSYNWWVICSACGPSKIDLFSYVHVSHHPPKGALSFSLLFPHCTLRSISQRWHAFQVIANLLKPSAKYSETLLNCVGCTNTIVSVSF